MKDKEMDCVLVNAKDNKGFVWSFTLRADNEDALFEKIEKVKAKFEKQEFNPSGRASFEKKEAPAQSTLTTKLTTKPTKMCKVHNIEMEQRISKSGKPYYSHFDQEQGICFGSGYKTKEY